ncbi:MAG: PASTA domain-containing protein [Chloroflexota bacterium]|nr:PASTA domain-containing protein [Chloroflexota bacterium]
MEFLGGALPNVMFIIGILAIGLGLGIELKLVALNKEIDKTGRIGAIVIGALLIAASLFMYLNPALTNRNQASSAPANAALAPAPATSAPAQFATAAPAAAAIAAPPEASPALAVPTATVVPTDAPAATAIPSVLVPDLHGMDDKGALRTLNDAGLTPKKIDMCSGADQGEANVKKGRVLCQNPAPDQPVAPGSTVDYVLAGR